MRTLRKRAWDKRKRCDAYRLMQYGFRIVGFVGLVVAVSGAGLAEIEPLTPELVMNLYGIIGGLCMILAILGDAVFKHLERVTRKELREDVRRMIKSAQERELHKGA